MSPILEDEPDSGDRSITGGNDSRNGYSRRNRMYAVLMTLPLLAILVAGAYFKWGGGEALVTAVYGVIGIGAAEAHRRKKLSLPDIVIVAIVLFVANIVLDRISAHVS